MLELRAPAGFARTGGLVQPPCSAFPARVAVSADAAVPAFTGSAGVGAFAAFLTRTAERAFVAPAEPGIERAVGGPDLHRLRSRQRPRTDPAPARAAHRRACGFASNRSGFAANRSRDSAVDGSVSGRAPGSGEPPESDRTGGPAPGSRSARR